MVHATSGSPACTMSSLCASYAIEVLVVPLTATRVTASRNQCVLKYFFEKKIYFHMRSKMSVCKLSLII